MPDSRGRTRAQPAPDGSAGGAPVVQPQRCGLRSPVLVSADDSGRSGRGSDEDSVRAAT